LITLICVTDCPQCGQTGTPGGNELLQNGQVGIPPMEDCLNGGII